MRTKVTPVNFTDDLEKIMQDEKCDAIGIDEMSITYTQPADTCDSPDEIQTITITTQCGARCGIEEAEKQEGFYFDVTIPEGHWSVNDCETFKALIEDFKKRLYMTNILEDEKQ